MLVDEFQDTNGAQTAPATQLTNRQRQRRPANILVWVKMTTRRFMPFRGPRSATYCSSASYNRDPITITLTDNYRSTDTVLTSARAVITQAKNA